MVLNFNKITFIIILAGIILFFQACKNDYEIALSTDNDQEGIFALDKLSEQDKIEDLAKHATNRRVREAAIKKVANQYTVYDIFGRSSIDSFYVRIAAASMLENQTYLINALATLFGPAFDEHRKAIAEYDTITANVLIPKVKDQLLLAFIGLKINEEYVKLNVNDSIVKTFILNKISDPDFLTLKKATENIPESHRWYIMSSILPVFQFVRTSKIQEKFGKINSFSLSWSSLMQNYSGVEVEGGIVNCTIHLQKFSKPLSYRWKSNFPNKVSAYGGADFIVHVPIEPENIIDPLLKLLTKDELNLFTDDCEYPYTKCWPIYFDFNRNLIQNNPFNGIKSICREYSESL